MYTLCLTVLIDNIEQVCTMLGRIERYSNEVQIKGSQIDNSSMDVLKHVAQLLLNKTITNIVSVQFCFAHQYFLFFKFNTLVKEYN